MGGSTFDIELAINPGYSAEDILGHIKEAEKG